MLCVRGWYSCYINLYIWNKTSRQRINKGTKRKTIKSIKHLRIIYSFHLQLSGSRSRVYAAPAFLLPGYIYLQSVKMRVQKTCNIINSSFRCWIACICYLSTLLKSSKICDIQLVSVIS